MLYYCSGYLGYLVMAHYIREHLTWSRSKRMRIGSITFLIGAIFTAWAFWYKGVPGVEMKTPALEWSWEFCTPNVLLTTFGAFLLFTCIAQKDAPKWITGISKLTFGMYLMHILILGNLAPFFMPEGPANPILPIYLTIPCMALLTFIACAAITKLISYIPGSKWMIG